MKHSTLTIVQLIAILILLIAISFVGSTRMFAHDWYDADCCTVNDCEPVPDEDVEEIADGWKHRPSGVEFKNDKGKVRIRPSHDQKFHVCKSRDYNTPYCIYIRLDS